MIYWDDGQQEDCIPTLKLGKYTNTSTFVLLQFLDPPKLREIDAAVVLAVVEHICAIIACSQ